MEVVEVKVGGGLVIFLMVEVGVCFVVVVFKVLLGEDCVCYVYVESKKDSGYLEFFVYFVCFGLIGVEEILLIG